MYMLIFHCKKMFKRAGWLWPLQLLDKINLLEKKSMGGGKGKKDVTAAFY